MGHICWPSSPLYHLWYLALEAVSKIRPVLGTFHGHVGALIYVDICTVKHGTYLCTGHFLWLYSGFDIVQSRALSPLIFNYCVSSRAVNRSTIISYRHAFFISLLLLLLILITYTCSYLLVFWFLFCYLHDFTDIILLIWYYCTVTYCPFVLIPTCLFNSFLFLFCYLRACVLVSVLLVTVKPWFEVGEL